jgi:hypothetical protein
MKGIVCALALLAASAPALADHRGDAERIGERRYRLEQRIEQGRRSGELTRHEYGRLRSELRLIARDEHAYRADGYLSRPERRYLLARLDAVSRAVYREKRDRERWAPYYNDHRADRRF